MFPIPPQHSTLTIFPPPHSSRIPYTLHPLVSSTITNTPRRADGTVKRGRGRGRGGTTRGDTASGRGRGGGRGGGPGSRGGTTVRKPRITKAERAMMEQEKTERERLGALAAKPVQYPGTVVS